MTALPKTPSHQTAHRSIRRRAKLERTARLNILSHQTKSSPWSTYLNKIDLPKTPSQQMKCRNNQRNKRKNMKALPKTPSHRIKGRNIHRRIHPRLADWSASQ